MRGRSVRLHHCTGSGLRDVDLTGAAPIGRGGDDVLRGGLLTGGLLLQMFGVGLGRGLRDALFRLQLGLTLGDDVVRLQDRDENIVVSAKAAKFNSELPLISLFCMV